MRIVCPWQDNGCEQRSAALAFVGSHLSEHHNGYALAELSAGQPWSKGEAVAGWLNHATMTDDLPDVLVIHDADVIVDPASLDAAVDAVQSGRVCWAIPHRQVWRLDERSTADVLAGAPLTSSRHRFERRYLGVEGGGVVVIAADLYDEAPFDQRFQGWSMEDLSAAFAWNTLGGKPWRADTPLHHAWHPPQPRLSAGVGSRASKLLHDRYRACANDRDAMRSLVAEGHGATMRT